jgi:DNA-binding transcriptional ArsR family regulator
LAVAKNIAGDQSWYRPALIKDPAIVLREAGLADTRRNGKSIAYRIARLQAMAVLQVVQFRFCRAALSNRTST